MKSFIGMLLLLLYIPHLLFSSWEEVCEIRIMSGDTPYGIFFQDIDCLDEDNCVTILYAGNMRIYSNTTTDGGKSWYMSVMDSIPGTTPWNYTYLEGNPMPKAVDYVSEDFCIAVGDSGYVWISRDKCKTWDISRIEGIIQNQKIFMYDNEFGIVTCYLGDFITRDGGNS